MAGDFQKQFNEALKEAELDDVKESVDTLRGLNPASQIRKQLNPFEKAAADVRSGLDSAMKPKPAASPAAAEPLKSGAPRCLARQRRRLRHRLQATTFPAMEDPAVATPARRRLPRPREASAKPAAAAEAGLGHETSRSRRSRKRRSRQDRRQGPGEADQAAAKPAKAATPKKPAGPAK